MLYFTATNTLMLQHISSGNLVNEASFVHPRRNLDHFVILVGKRGTLHVAQNGTPYDLGPNHYLLLSPGCEHYGYRPSEGELSYHWCHFRVRSDYQMLNENAMQQRMFMLQNDSSRDSVRNMYVLPEHGDIAAAERTRIIFHQLLDLAMRDSYSTYMVDCALSMLGMEITQNFIDAFRMREDAASKSHRSIVEILEWLRVNYAANLSVQVIADRFNYNPDYLSTTFRKTTGYSLLKYVHKLRISSAKRLLLDSGLSVKEIAHRCGFHDEKNFMKLFKQLEEVTPSQYRTAYFQRKMNRE